jgi:uncharacterized delta-60 repeat protein
VHDTCVIAKLDEWRPLVTLPCVLAAALAACGFPRPGDIAPEQQDTGDFTVTLDAARVRVSEGDSATVGVKLVRNGFSGPVTLTVAGLPTGVTADPLTVDGKTGTLTLRAAAGVTQGDAMLTVTATGAGQSHDVAVSLLAMGPPGTLDMTFGAGGALRIPVAADGEALAIQPDGKIVIVGWVTTGNSPMDMVTRYLPDGTLDASFGTNGVQLLSFTQRTRPVIAVQPDGKIIVAEMVGGRSQTAILWRLNAVDGSPDNDFGSGGQEPFDLSDQGQFRTLVTSVVVQPTGDLVVAGTANNPGIAFIAQFTSRGALDLNFGTQGRTFTALGSTTSNILALARQPGGLLAAIGVAGTSGVATLARFTSRGDLDPSFVDGGFYTLAFSTTPATPAAMTVEPGGKLVAVGAASGTYVARMVGDSGGLDPSFGTDGIDHVGQLGTGSFPTGIAVQSDGKYVIVGNVGPGGGRSPFLARMFPNQIFDGGFGNAGVVRPVIGGTSSQFQSMALDADGRIAVTGVESMAFGSGIPDQLLLYRFWP